MQIDSNRQVLEQTQLTKINWPGGRPRDAVALPTEPALLALLAKYQCTVAHGANCFEIINERGDAIEVPYGFSLTQWEAAALCVRDYHDPNRT